MTRRIEEVYVTYGESSTYIPRSAVLLGGRFRGTSFICWYMYDVAHESDRVNVNFKMQGTWDAIDTGWRWLCADIDTMHGTVYHVFYRSPVLGPVDSDAVHDPICHVRELDLR